MDVPESTTATQQEDIQHGHVVGNSNVQEAANRDSKHQQSSEHVCSYS